MDTPDHNYASLSELESLSDSDWLDISSRGDEDSIAGFDSDREDTYSRPVSRRSFSSAASSRDEVVEGWEGLIEDSSDETPYDTRTVDDLFANATGESGHSHSPAVATIQEEDPDDERVKAALDQSMMSTLSSPRSNSLSNSIQTSIVHSTRSLRLSFPDPTTSRLQSLHTSFEDLPPLDADMSSADVAAEATLPPDDSTAEPDHLSPSEEAHSGELVRSLPSVLRADFHVVLYGSSPVTKFALVEMLLDKWARSYNLIRGQKYVHVANTIMHEYECFTPGSKTTKKLISVTDKTGLENVGLSADLTSTFSFIDHQSHLPFEFDAPSIALVFLPFYSDISLLDHTLYLPIIMSSPPSSVDTLGSSDYLLEAEQQWEAQAVPSSQLTSFSRYSSPIVEQETLEKATSQQVLQAFHPLFSSSAKTVMPKVSANTLTILAILSIVLGYIVHGSLNTPIIDAITNRTVATPLTGLLRPSLAGTNKSQPTALTTPSASNLALSVITSKNLELATVNLAPASTATSSTAQSVSYSSSAVHSHPSAPAECGCGCGLLTLSGKAETTDVILRPTASGLTAIVESITSISVISPPPQGNEVKKGKGKASISEASLHALSTRIATSLSEYLERTPLGKSTPHDLQEIFDAIDQLSSAISDQTSSLWEQSKGTASTIQAKFEKRNERARRRAKRMRAVGARWISSVKERIRTHTDLAKVNARALTEQFVERLEARHQVSKAKAKAAAAQGKSRKRRSERRIAHAAAKA